MLQTDTGNFINPILCCRYTDTDTAMSDSMDCMVCTSDSTDAILKPTTRSETDIWLIGQLSDTLISTKLPSKKEVMALFYHYKQVTNKTVREAAHSTANDVLAVWAKAHIPTRLKKHVVNKIQCLFKEYDNLKRNKENKAKRSETLKKKEEEWKVGLDVLFDIAHANAMEMIRIQEDREFLLAQREPGRRGKMGSVDKVLEIKRASSQKRKEYHDIRIEKERQERTTREKKVTLESSSDSDTDSKKGQEIKDPETEDIKPSTSAKRQKRGRVYILDDKMSACLDVAKVSDRSAALLLVPTLQHLGHDPAEYNVNRSSIRRDRMKRRQAIAENLRQEFKPSVPLTIHWDGKLLEDICSRQIVDRLPILVSGAGVDQLLGVPKLASGTGQASAAAVFEAAVAWNITDNVKCMCFDTTSVNSGPRNGACILLEQKLDKDMLWFACRHHILEIVLQAVVLDCLGPSKGPEITIFNWFKNTWQFINRADFQTASSDECVFTAVSHVITDIIAFAEMQTLLYQPRDDYRELLDLTIIFLGGTPSKGISFRAPAGLHQARWMAKAIYALKIWMFRSQFKLTKRQEKALADICQFTVIIYVKAWFQASSAPSAPRIDLQLLKDIYSYRKISESISKNALNKIIRHLWYLSEELVALAFFDDEVSNDTKHHMVTALQTSRAEHPLKRITVDPLTLGEKKLENFVTQNTNRFFSITGLPSSFLTKNIDLWSVDEDYQTVKNIVHSMRVINDIAERGVALMDDYNKLHTTSEEQKQFLLLVVKEYRQRYSDRTKKTLMNQSEAHM